MLSAMKITDPYSPTPRAKARVKPVSRAGAKADMTASRDARQRVQNAG